MTKITELFRHAVDGKPQARQELYFRTTLVPELEDFLAEVFEAKPLIVMEPDSYEADEIGVIRWSVVERTVAKAIVDASEWASPIVSAEDKLEATQELREALQSMVDRLDDRIDDLHDALEAGQGRADEAASA